MHDGDKPFNLRMGRVRARVVKRVLHDVRHLTAVFFSFATVFIAAPARPLLYAEKEKPLVLSVFVAAPSDAVGAQLSVDAVVSPVVVVSASGGAHAFSSVASVGASTAMEPSSGDAMVYDKTWW